MVVVDEAHMYKGLFGSHVALVLRRLQRLCLKVYSSSPSFMFTSATIANPGEHAAALIGCSVDEIEVVTEDSSPSSEKKVVFWNPPLTESARRLKELGEAKEDRKTARGRQREAQRILAREGNAERMGARQLGERRGVEHGDWLASVAIGRKRDNALGTISGLRGGKKARVDSRGTGDDGLGQAGGVEGRILQIDGAASLPAARLAERIEVDRAPPSDMVDVSKRILRGSGIVSDAAEKGRGAARVAAGAALAVRLVESVGADPSHSRTGQPLLRRRIWGSRSYKRATQGEDARGDLAAEALRPEGWRSVALKSGEAAGGLGVLGRSGKAGTLEDEQRCSPIVETALLLGEAVQHGLRTIAFCKTRKLCELVASYTREILMAAAPHLTNCVSVYRGGYSAEDRREIEAALFSGKLRGVAATNALELGVDVGHLDCTIHLGFPGTVASLWQQAGRAGRRGQTSLAMYVAFDGPLDQYFMRQPALLLEKAIERACIDCSNMDLMALHVECAAAEHPVIVEDDIDVFGATLGAVVQALRSERTLGRPPNSKVDAWVYIGGEDSPAATFGLRAIDAEQFQIIDESSKEKLEEIEESKAFFEVYEGAIYLFQGRSFLCKKLDVAGRIATVRAVHVKYYTVPVSTIDIHVIGGHNAYSALGTGDVRELQRRRFGEGASGTGAGGFLQSSGAGQTGQDRVREAAFSDCVVSQQWLGFHRIWKGSGKVFDTVDLFLPPSQFATQAAFLRLPQGLRAEMRDMGLPFREGIHGAAHGILNVIGAFLSCNAGDIKAECDNPYQTRYRPERLLLYDGQPGGVGLAAQAAPLFPQLVKRALDLVKGCDCSDPNGCPGCIFSTDCTQYNAILHKGAAIHVLECVDSILDPGRG